MMLIVGVTVRFIPDSVSVSKKTFLPVPPLSTLQLLLKWFPPSTKKEKNLSISNAQPQALHPRRLTLLTHSASEESRRKKSAKVTLLPLHHHRLQSRMQRRRRSIHKPLNLNIRIRLFQIPPIRRPLHNPPHILQQILITTQINRHKFSKRRQRKNHHNIRHRKFFARQPRFFRDAAVEDAEDLMHFFEIAD